MEPIPGPDPVDPVGGYVRAWFEDVEGPGLGRLSAAADPSVTADGARLALTGSTRVSLDEPAHSGVAVVDLATGTIAALPHGPHDRLPRWSPDGTRLAWLTDHGTPGRSRPAWSAAAGGPVSTADLPPSEGVAWSPDGRRLLAVVRADDGPGPTSTGPTSTGPTSTGPRSTGVDDWRPTVLRPAEPGGRRSVVVVDVASGAVTPVGPPGVNVWEAAWCGPDAVAAVISDGPGEESWYSARLAVLTLGAAAVAPDPFAPDPVARDLYRSRVQLGRPAATASGGRVAVIEAFCSDRSLVAGSLVVLRPGGGEHPGGGGHSGGGELVRPATAGVDVTAFAWVGEDLLAFIGVRGLSTVAGEVDLRSGAVRETWVGDGSTSGAYPEAAWSADGTVHLVAESYREPPHVVVVRDGVPRTVLDLAHEGTTALLRRAGQLEAVSWEAPDGLRIEGLLVRPATPGPHPLVLDIHGGPIWAWRNQFRMGQYTTPLLASLGYAVLFPNPRGSTGRGAAYTRLIERDVCGPDTHDFLSGLDQLVAAGIADPSRIAVTGTSYGGTMACWLPTQDPRFAAAVPVSGGTDWVSFHFSTDIPDFDELVLPGDALDRDGEYVRRSPLTYARAVRTPVLHLAGALDTCVPVGQALEFHRALSLRGAESELVVYPKEGHGVHEFPAVADAVARTVGWIVAHLPSGAALTPPSSGATA